jgi:alkylhydroperoxidase family enzyme
VSPTDDHPRHPERIAPLTEWDEATGETLSRTLGGASGAPLAIFRTLAHHPRLLKRFNGLGGLFLAHGELPPRDRELVILRTAWRTEAEYEWAQHAVIGARVGLTADEIGAVGSIDAPAGGDDDRSLLHFTDELVDTASVGDELWAVQRARWSDSQLIELVTLIGFYRMVAGFLNTVGVQLEPGLTGWPSGSGT